MMAPTVVLRDGQVELVLGSAGSNRIRSALLQTIVGVVDHGLSARAAVQAPRVHFEDDTLFAEPGIDLSELAGSGAAHDAPSGAGGQLPAMGGMPQEVVEFHELNLFFGGVQAVERDPVSGFSGGGDERRGGAAIVVGTGFAGA